MKRDAEFILIEMVVMIAGGPGVIVLYLVILVSIFILIKKICNYIQIYFNLSPNVVALAIIPFQGFSVFRH